MNVAVGLKRIKNRIDRYGVASLSPGRYHWPHMGEDEITKLVSEVEKLGIVSVAFDESNGVRIRFWTFGVNYQAAFTECELLASIICEDVDVEFRDDAWHNMVKNFDSGLERIRSDLSSKNSYRIARLVLLHT